MSTRWMEIIKKSPGLSPAAHLFLAERAELADLLKLKRMPVRAVVMLEASIREQANYLIQAGVYA